MRLSGSAGGLYEASVIAGADAPFDLLVLKGVNVAKQRAAPLLEINPVNGNHFTSLPMAVQLFLSAVEAP